LHHAFHLIGPDVGICEDDVSVRSLRADGAMALMCALVDGIIINIIGHWQSDIMLRYLHVQARPIMYNFATQMLQHGTYELVPKYQH
jgi:hypothetical protein